MPKPPRPPEELLDICNRWSESVEGISGDAARIEFFKNELPGFLRKQAVFEKLLKNIKAGSPYPDLRQARMIDDEILLYLNPRRLFSLRMFLYGPGDYTPIHDHSSWGVSGAAVGENWESSATVAKTMVHLKGMLNYYRRHRFICSREKSN
jgi:hypothetical protein